MALLSHSCNVIDVVLLEYRFDYCWSRSLSKVHNKSLLGTETVIDELYVVVISQIHIVRVIVVVVLSQRTTLTFTTRLLPPYETLLNTFNVFRIASRIISNDVRFRSLCFYIFKSYSKTRNAR